MVLYMFPSGVIYTISRSEVHPFHGYARIASRGCATFSPVFMLVIKTGIFAVVPVDVGSNPGQVCSHKRGEVDLVDNTDRAIPEHHRVLVDYVVTFVELTITIRFSAPSRKSVGQTMFPTFSMKRMSICPAGGARSRARQDGHRGGIPCPVFALVGRDTLRHDPLEIIIAKTSRRSRRPEALLHSAAGTRRSMSAVFPEPIAPSRSKARMPCSFKCLAFPSAIALLTSSYVLSILTSMWCIPLLFERTVFIS